MSLFRRLAKKDSPQRKPPKHSGILEFEPLEERAMLSTIVWTNRGSAGNDSDHFQAAFGANATAARVVIDTVLDHWERIIPSFNTTATGSVPADTFNVQFTMEELPSGTNGASSFPQVDSSGRPRSGSIKLDFNGSPNDAVTSNWFVDTTPNDNSEFLLTEITSGIPYSATTGRAQSGSPAANKLDLYTIASHELFHLLGLSTPSNLRLFTTPGLVTDTGIPQNPGTLWSFTGPSTQFLMTSRNGFSAEPRPGHMADPSAVMPANAQFPIGLRGAGGLGSVATGTGIRLLPSLTDALFLKDAYGYSTVDPEQFGTFYSVLNTSTGELTVRGQFNNLFNDQIRISQSNGIISTSVDNTADQFANGTAINAFVTSYPASSVTSIKVIGTDADSIVISKGISVPITVTGTLANFNSLTLEGNDLSEVFTVNNNQLSVVTAGTATVTTVNYSGIQSIGIKGFGGDDTVNFHATSADAAALNGGLGNDTFNVSPTARDLDNVISTFLSINGEGGTDTAVLEDRNDTVGRTFAITTNRVTRGGIQLLNYGTLENLTINGTPLVDTFNVQTTPAITKLTADGFGGNDQFNVGLNNDMSGVLGVLSLIGGSDVDSFRLNDQAALTNNNYTVFNNRIERSNGSTIFYDIGNITLQAPNTANTITVESADATGNYELIGNGGTDTFAVTPTTQLFSGLFPELASGRVVVRGGAGTDSLVIHDQARTTGGSYTGFGDQIRVGGNTNTAAVAWDTTENVTFNGGAGNDTFNVEGGGGATIPTVINGSAGDDTYNVTPDARNFDLISGLFTLNGGLNNDRVAIQDSARTTATNVVFTDTSITRPGTTKPAVTLASIERQQFNGGTGTNTLNASAVTVPVTLFGNTGQDFLTGGSNNDSLVGGAGNDTLTGNDGNDLLVAGSGIDTLLGGNGDDTASQVDAGDSVDLGAGEDGILIQGTSKNDVISVGRQLGPSGPQAVIQMNGQSIVHDYLNGETVTVLGGNGNDQITLESSAGATWKAIFHGENGNDTLTGSLQEDILDGGDGNDRLIGGGGHDELYGDAGNDYLQGDSGDDRLHGGDGNDQLVGNEGEDHLHGGTGVDTYDGGADADWVYADADGVVDFIYIDNDDVLVSLEDSDRVLI